MNIVIMGLNIYHDKCNTIVLGADGSALKIIFLSQTGSTMQNDPQSTED